MTQAEKIKLYEDLRNELFLTFEEIAEALNTNYEGLIQWIAKTYNRKEEDVREEGEAIKKVKVRKMQLDLSKYNPRMAIWLGKQILNQKDNTIIEQTTETNINDTDKQILELLKKGD